MKLRFTCIEQSTTLCDDYATVNVVCRLSPKSRDYLISLGAQCVPEVFFGHGVATYKEDDEQDIELGHKVARKKAIRQAYKHVENFLFQLLSKKMHEVYKIGENFHEISGRVEKMTSDILKLTTDEVEGN